MNGETNQDAVAVLLRRAGRRAAPPDEGVERARAAAHRAWRDEIRSTRRQRLVRAGLGVAAVSFLVLAIDRDAPVPARSTGVAARLVAASGPVEVAGRSLAAGEQIPLDAAVRTAAGALATFRMADGVELRLDAESAVTFPAAGTVTLAQGGAFFDTGLRKGDAPIEVRTAIGTVHDIGTRFEVRLVDNAMRVRVRDGVVEMESGGATQRAERGTELVARLGGGMTRRPVITAGADWEWIARAAEPFAIEGKTLQDFLEWVSRESGWRVTFATEALARSTPNVILHGGAARLTPEEALRVVLPTCGLTHRVDGDTVIVQVPDGGGRP